MGINNLQWKIDAPKKSYFFVGLSGDNPDGEHFYDCILLCGLFGYEVRGEKFGETMKFDTAEEAINAAKDILLARHDPFGYALFKVNSGIDKSVSEAKHRLHLRLAEFRGFLFSQAQTLRL